MSRARTDIAASRLVRRRHQLPELLGLLVGQRPVAKRFLGTLALFLGFLPGLVLDDHLVPLPPHVRERGRDQGSEHDSEGHSAPSRRSNELSFEVVGLQVAVLTRLVHLIVC